MVVHMVIYNIMASVKNTYRQLEGTDNKCTRINRFLKINGPHKVYFCKH